MNPLINAYIKYTEKTILNKKEYWHKIKINNNILNTAIKINNNKFISNIIANKILEDEYFNNSEIKKNLINTILNNIDIARTLADGINSFLTKITMDNTINLNDKDKEFIISETINSSNPEKRQKQPKTITHSIASKDLRYYILLNKNFTFDEKKELIKIFYKDELLLLCLLDELETDLWLSLNPKENYNTAISKIYEDNINYNENIKNKLILAKHIKNIIPEEIINENNRL